MSNQPNDYFLEPLWSLKKALARLWSPELRSVNLNSVAANRRPSSAPPILRTPSSAIRAADAGVAVAGEIPNKPFVHQVNIDPHSIKHCRQPGWTPFTWAFPGLDWSVLLKMLLFKVNDDANIGHLKSHSFTSTAPPSNLPVVDPGLKSASKFYNSFLLFIWDASSLCRSFN